MNSSHQTFPQSLWIKLWGGSGCGAMRERGGNVYGTVSFHGFSLHITLWRGSFHQHPVNISGLLKWRMSPSQRRILVFCFCRTGSFCLPSRDLEALSSSASSLAHLCQKWRVQNGSRTQLRAGIHHLRGTPQELYREQPVSSQMNKSTFSGKWSLEMFDSQAMQSWLLKSTGLADFQCLRVLSRFFSFQGTAWNYADQYFCIS